MIRFKISLVFILTAILACLVYLQADLSSSQQHRNRLNKLYTIDNDTLLLHGQVLQIHQGLLRNHNDLLTTISRMETTVASLKSLNIEQNNQHPNKIEHLQQVINKLGQSTEHFLVVNTVLNNSLTHLPVLINNFYPRTEEQRRTTHQLLEETFLYNRWQEPERKTKIDSLNNKLLLSSIIMKPDAGGILNSIISHSELITANTDLVNLELKAIFSSEIASIIDSIRQQHMQLYTEKTLQKQYFNWGIYCIAFGLILLLFNFISTIRNSADSLRESNAKLLSEVRQRSEAETRQRAEAIFLQTILDNTSDGIVACDEKGVLVVFNKAAEAIYGQGLNAIDANHWAQQYQLYGSSGKELLKKEQLPLYKSLTEGRVDDEEIVVKFNSGSPKTVLINGKQLLTGTQKNGAVICIRDITAFKYQQEEIIRSTGEETVLTAILQYSFLPLDTFLQQSAEAIVSLPWLKLKPKSGIFLTDKNDNKILNLVCNHNLSTELLTLCAKVPFGKCWCGRAAESGEIQFSACVDHRHEISFENMEPHGHYNVPIMEGKKVLGVIVLYLTLGHQQQDCEITFLKRAADVLSLGISRQQAEHKVEYLAYHDDLTALPNRILLRDRLEQAIASNKRQKHYSALMYIDFDRFKNINDSLGHSVGDALLKEVSNRFKRLLRQEDTIARLGGDEFVILLTSSHP